MPTDANDFPLCECGHSSYGHQRIDTGPDTGHVIAYPCMTCDCDDYQRAGDIPVSAPSGEAPF